MNPQTAFDAENAENKREGTESHPQGWARPRSKRESLLYALRPSAISASKEVSPAFIRAGKSRTSPSAALWMAMLAGSVAISGCAGTPRSVQALPEVERSALPSMQQQITEEAHKLAQSQDALREGLTVKRPLPVLPMVQPMFDPLEQTTLNVALNGATVSQIMGVFADQARLNLIVDPAVLALDKRADLHLKNVSVREAIDNVMAAFDVHGRVQGNTLRVDLMEERVFSLDFLNTVMGMEVSAGGNVFGAGSSGGGGGGGGGGSAGGAGGANALRGDVIISGGNGGKTDPYEQIEAAVKSIIGDRQQSQRKGRAEDKADEEEMGAGAAYSLNRLSGSLYVKARPSQIRGIEKTLERTQKVLRRQVQIEAQLLDVQLSDGFELGVDWDLLRSHVAGRYGVDPGSLQPTAGTLPNAGNGLPTRVLNIPERLLGSANGASLGLAYQGGSFAMAIRALRSFGTVKVLSNPSVMVRNGTPALLSVGTSSRYVASSLVSVTNPGGGATTTTATVETDSVFAGLMVGVIPFVRDDGRVELLVHPMQTDVEQQSLQLIDVGNGIRVTLPVVNYKGMTTTLNLGDGDMAMIGGLIDQRQGTNDRGAPGLSDVPLFGMLFGNQDSSHAARELVMVLRVKVL